MIKQSLDEVKGICIDKEIYNLFKHHAFIYVKFFEDEKKIKEFFEYYGNGYSYYLIKDKNQPNLFNLPTIEPYESETYKEQIEKYGTASINYMLSERFDGQMIDYSCFQDATLILDKVKKQYQFQIDPISGILYVFTGAVWEAVTDVQLDRLLFENWSQRVRLEQISLVVRMLKSTICTSVKNSKALSWRKLPNYYIPFSNGVFDTKTKILHEHSQYYYLESTLPWDYEPENVKCPNWHKYLDMVLPDQLSQKILQQFMGYLILPHAKMRKALILYGPKKSGKSTLTLVMSKIVGFQNICCIPLQDLGDARKRENIVGKSLNIVDEFEYEQHFSEAGFKQLISIETPVKIDPKGVTPFMYIPYAKHVFSTNELPDLTKLSEPVRDRVIFLIFKQIKGETDPFFDDKLEEEMSAIINWAIQGAKSLMEAKMFINDGHKELTEVASENSDIQQFINKFYLEDKDGLTSLSEFIQRLKLLYPKYETKLNRDIRNELETIGYPIEKKNIVKQGKRSNEYCILGIKLIGRRR